MTHVPTVLRRSSKIFYVLLAAALAFTLTSNAAEATHQPADKVAAAGSAAKVFSPGQDVVLLQEKVKTSSPTDLILGVTAECVITTELMTVGNDAESAEGTVRIWVEVDGVPVPVSSDDPAADRGKVTFCNQLEQRKTTMFDDANATIETLNQSGAANAFQWLRLNMGSGIHTLTVKGSLTTTATEGSDAKAAVGKRTLIVEPVKAANDEAVTALGD